MIKYKLLLKNVEKFMTSFEKKYEVKKEDVEYKVIIGKDPTKAVMLLIERLNSDETLPPEEEEKVELEGGIVASDEDEEIEIGTENIKIRFSEQGIYLTIKEGVEDLSISEIVDFVIRQGVKSPYPEKVQHASNKQGKEIKIAEYIEGLYKTPEIEVEISEDKLEAEFMVTKEGIIDLFTIDKVKTLLAEKNINFGIDEKIIKKVIEGNKREQFFLVAKGIAPIDGEDAKIEYHVKALKQEHLGPKVLDDGSVDFKDMGIFESVEKDKLLARKIPLTLGQDGTGVTGEVLPSKAGEDLEIIAGQNTVLSPDKMELKSEINGMIKVTEDKKIEVSEVIQIDKVGVTTGNIIFKGAVIISGDVQAGYEIRAGGDIEIGGNVEKAHIESRGRVLIKGGFFGKGSGEIVAGEDVFVNFIDNAIIETKGEVIISQGVIGSKISSEGKVSALSNKGSLLNTKIITFKGVEALTIGSESDKNTHIQVGADPKIIEEIRRLDEELESTNKKLKEVEKNLNFLETMKKRKRAKFGKDKQIMLKNLLKSKFSLGFHVDEITTEIESNRRKLREMTGAFVDVHGICYPGVKIQIGESSYLVENELQNIRFFFEDKKVKFLPRGEAAGKDKEKEDK